MIHDGEDTIELVITKDEMSDEIGTSFQEYVSCNNYVVMCEVQTLWMKSLCLTCQEKEEEEEEDDDDDDGRSEPPAASLSALEGINTEKNI